MLCVSVERARLVVDNQLETYPLSFEAVRIMKTFKDHPGTYLSAKDIAEGTGFDEKEIFKALLIMKGRKWVHLHRPL